MVLDNYDFADEGGEQLQILHKLLLNQLDRLAGTDQDSWYQAVADYLVASLRSPWCLAILAHIAADEQMTVGRTLALDHLSLGLLLFSSRDAEGTEAERVVSYKSLSSAYLSLAESYLGLGLRNHARGFAQEAWIALGHLDQSSYKKKVSTALSLFARNLSEDAPHDAQ